jgi:hypothetical protein
MTVTSIKFAIPHDLSFAAHLSLLFSVSVEVLLTLRTAATRHICSTFAVPGTPPNTPQQAQCKGNIAAMIIPLAASEYGIKEWALVELQGKIEPQQDVDLQESLTVGTMQLSKTVRHFAWLD